MTTLAGLAIITTCLSCAALLEFPDTVQMQTLTGA